MKASETLDKIAKRRMTVWSLEGFKRQYATLYKVIIESIYVYAAEMWVNTTVELPHADGWYIIRFSGEVDEFTKAYWFEGGKFYYDKTKEKRFDHGSTELAYIGNMEWLKTTL